VQRSFIIFVSALLILATPASFAADVPMDPFEQQIRQNLKVEKYKLKNGLTVLLHVDDSVPVIAYHQWFKVGSANEKVGRTGLAHFFEHLMFKGTTKYPGKVYERIVSGNGGANNAFTTRDYTGYYTFLPSDKLELIIDIEADRMRNLLMDEKEIKSEREVVKEERRMRYENDIYGAMNELTFSTIYKTSQYRWPVIGYMADLNATSMKELKEFYNTYYAPNNTIVVLAGAFDPSKAKKLIEKYYGSIESQTIPELKFTPEATQRAPRRARLEKPVQGVTAAYVYPSEAAGHAANYALDLATNILGEGPSSRLYKKLVYQDQIATGVGVYNSNDQRAGRLQVNLNLKPGVSLVKATPVVEREIARMAAEEVTGEELQKVKNQVMMSYVSGLKTINGKARALALNEAYFGDYQMLFYDLGRYNNVTAADIQKAVRDYFVPTKMTTISVEPKKN
jgi:zinc protease